MLIRIMLHGGGVLIAWRRGFLVLMGGTVATKTVFEERFDVDVRKRLPQFSTMGGHAYMAVDNDNATRPVYALVHERGIPPRQDMYDFLRGAPVKNIVSPVAQGVMTLPFSPAEQRLVTIFTRPTGPQLIDENGKLEGNLNPAAIRQHVVIALIKALASLHKKGFVHRSIHPAKLFYLSEGSEDVVVGECVSTPAGYNFPSALEPLEVAFADPACRGNASAASDFYQMGVALMSLYYGEALWAERKRTAFLMARVNQGSYFAVGGGREVSGALGSLIRGLMADTFDERWDAADVLDWFEGLAKQKRTTMRAHSMNRPTNFRNTAYVDRRLLADAFNREEKDAANFIRKLEVPSWVQVSMRDDILTEQTESLLNVRSDDGYSSSSPAEDSRMVSRMCMFLDPAGPIRFKGMSVFLDGLPTLMAQIAASEQREGLATLVELFDYKTLKILVEIAGDRNALMNNQVVEIRRYIDIIGSKQLGLGLERVLYDMNPSLPCLSIKFQGYWVSGIKQMLYVLNDLSKSGTMKGLLQDRHICAFLASRSGDLDRDFAKITSLRNDPARLAASTAELLGRLQSEQSTGPLPDLANKLVETLLPAVKELKNKKSRDVVSGLLDKVKKGGDLSRLTSEVNMEKIQMMDTREFNAARNALLKIDKEKHRLSRKISPNDPEAQLRGLQAARTFAILGLVGTVMVLLL